MGGCCGALTQDSQLDLCAKAVGSGWSQAGSRNERVELWATIESGGVCGEVACEFPQPNVAKCGPCVARFSHFFKRKDICGVLFLRHNLNTIKYINPNDFLHMYTFYICNHHPYRDMEHFHLSESSVVLLSKSIATPPSPKVTTDLYIHK